MRGTTILVNGVGEAGNQRFRDVDIRRCGDILHSHNVH